MGCCSTTEAAAQPPEAAMAPSAWVLRRRERLQQQQQQRSTGNDFVATTDGDTELDFGFCALPEDEGSSHAEVLGSPRPSTRGSDFAPSLGPSSVDASQATLAAGLLAGRHPPTADGNPLRAGPRDLASPSPASDVVVGDLLVATAPRQPPTLPRAARVLRFSPMLLPEDA